MVKEQKLLLLGHFFLFCTELIKELLAKGMEDSPEECSAKDGSSLVVGERVTQLWYITKTQPPVGKGMKVK